MDLKAEAFPRGAPDKACLQTGRPDLSARLPLLRSCGCDRREYRSDEQAGDANRYFHLRHRPPLRTRPFRVWLKLRSRAEPLLPVSLQPNRVDIVMPGKGTVSPSALS